MKTKIKRHSRSVLSVVLTLCMLVSCMAVGLVTTDAAKVENSGSAAVGAATNDNEAVGAAVNDSETVGAAANDSEAVGAAANDSGAVGASANDSQAVGAKVDNGASVGGDGTATNYGITGSFNGWATTEDIFFNSSSTRTVTINTPGDYEFKVYHKNPGKWYGASVTFSGSQTNYYFNTNNSSNATLKVTTTGTYTFKFRRGDNDDGAVSIDIIYPSAAVYYNVNVNGASNGTVTASPTRATKGTNVTLTATPDRGYTLSSLEVKNNSTNATVASSTSGNSLSFRMPAANVTVTATFTESTKHTITANATTNGTVTITVKKDGTTVGTATTSATAAATLTAYDGEKLTIKTNPNAGYVVDTCSPPAGEGYPISGDVTVTATFKVNDTLPPNQKRAKLSSDTLNNTDLYTKIGATFYDYYTNHEYVDKWYSSIVASTDGWTGGAANWNRNPYGYFNQALSVYAKTNGIEQPLYFCAMNFNTNGGADAFHDPGYYYSNKRVNGHLINDSNYLGGNTKVLYGLSGTTLVDGVPTYSNGKKMVLFDKDWLTSRDAGSGSNTEGTNRVYFDPGPWDKDGARFYAEIQDGDQTAWNKQELSQDANGAYYYDYPTNGGTKIRFFRMSSDGNSEWARVEVAGTHSSLADKMVRVMSYKDGNTYTEPISYHGNDTKYEKTGALATIVEGNFPVVKTTKYGSVSEDGTNRYTYYKFDSTNGTDNVYFTRSSNNTIKDTNGMLEMNYGDSGYGIKAGYNNTKGFFPFDHKDENNGYGKDMGLGMKLEIPFTLGPNGKIKGDDQVFDFSGDDDLWVFIDGKLVLDLGGNHARTTGNINFHTKTASATGGYNTTFNSDRNGEFQIDYLDAQGNPIKHTMTIFYMERGLHESNLQFGFSFAPIPDVYDVEKEVDTTGLNSGLTNQISDTFTFTNTSEDSKGANAAYKSYQSSDNAQLPGGTTDSTGALTMAKGTSAFTKQYAQFKGIFTHNKWLQTSETTTGKWLYDTTYEVHDVQNNSTLVKSGRGTKTGQFNFFTTKANADPDFDATHLRTTFTNKLKLNSFTLTKEIEDTSGNPFYDSNANFTFYLSMTDAQNNPLNPVGLQYTRNGGTPETLAASGTSNVATGKIKQGDSLFFAGIPAGAKITVWEGTRGSEYICEGDGQEQYYYLNTITNNNTGNSTNYTGKTGGTAAKFTFTLNQNDNITILNTPVPRVNVSVKKVTNVSDDGTYFPITITVSTFGPISGTTIDNYMFTTVIPRSATDVDVPAGDPTVYFSNASGIFWMKKDAQIVIANVPKGAKVTALETDFDDYDVGKFISRETRTEFYFDAENCRIVNDISHLGPSDRFGYANAEVGAQDLAITIANKYIGVKATIRVQYAPSYYDFENKTSNIEEIEYKYDGGVYNHISPRIGCVTDFTDEAKTTTAITQYETTETAQKDGSKNFKVEVSEVNIGGYLFIGWYDEDGNRYNDSDESQHDFTASAPKDQDRVFIARFIPQPTYRVDYDIPTRLWGNRIYKVFGKVNNSMITNKYIGYNSKRAVNQRYYLTRLFVESNKPYESIFLKNITWPNIDDGTTSTQYKVSKLVTSNTDTNKNVETVTDTGNVTYDLYRAVAAQVTDRRVTIDFYNDCSKPDKLNFQWKGTYGDVVDNHSTLAVNIPDGQTFYRWKIETLNSLGGTALTANGVLVTYDYSKNFNYVAYDNYKVTVETIPKKGDKDYNPYAAQKADDPYNSYAPKNKNTVVNLGLTRSHWNDTEDGKEYVPNPEKGESLQRTNANYNYDRLFIDLALSYSDNEIKLNTQDRQVGFIIEYKKADDTWAVFDDVNFSSKKLGDKNRIEYYYGFLNVNANRNAQFRVQPTIDGNRVADCEPLAFSFRDDVFKAQTNY